MTGIVVARKRLEGLDGLMPAVDAAQAALRQRLTAVESLVPMAAQRANEDEEYVHQLRVASRRADAALRIFRPFLQRKACAKARKALKRVRRAAGDARECDVQAHLLLSFKAPRGDEHVGNGQMQALRASAIQRLVEDWRRERESAQRKIVNIAERYHSRKLGRIRARLLTSLEPVNLDREGDDERAMTFAALAGRRLAEFGDAVRKQAGRVERSGESTSALHALRIRAKRLRYAMEIFASCYAGGLKTAYRRIESMQDALGRINDLDDLAARLAHALNPRSGKQTKQADAGLTLEEHASIDALRQQVLRERDDSARQFAQELVAGEWADVVQFEVPEAKVMPRGAGDADAGANAEVRR